MDLGVFAEGEIRLGSGGYKNGEVQAVLYEEIIAAYGKDGWSVLNGRGVKVFGNIASEEQKDQGWHGPSLNGGFAGLFIGWGGAFNNEKEGTSGLLVTGPEQALQEGNIAVNITIPIFGGITIQVSTIKKNIKIGKIFVESRGHDANNGGGSVSVTGEVDIYKIQRWLIKPNK